MQTLINKLVSSKTHFPLLTTSGSLSMVACSWHTNSKHLTIVEVFEDILKRYHNIKYQNVTLWCWKALIWTWCVSTNKQFHPFSLSLFLSLTAAIICFHVCHWEYQHIKYCSIIFINTLQADTRDSGSFCVVFKLLTARWQCHNPSSAVTPLLLQRNTVSLDGKKSAHIDV